MTKPRGATARIPLFVIDSSGGIHDQIIFPIFAGHSLRNPLWDQLLWWRM
ncbi:MAG: hypothetical protein ACJ8KC_04030 [Candidatus Udaeobacter sp.]